MTMEIATTPWKVVETKTGLPKIVDASGFSIASFRDKTKTTVGSVALMVAAPDLLNIAREYLHHLWETMHSGMTEEAFNNDPDVVKVRAAIAKATGDQP